MGCSLGCSAGPKARAQPVDRVREDAHRPGGAAECRGERGRVLESALPLPLRAGGKSRDAFHGLRDAQGGIAPPVATALDPSGVENGARLRRREVPEARHAPLASADLHASGSEVRRGGAFFVPEGRRDVATAGARASRVQPVGGTWP